MDNANDVEKYAERDEKSLEAGRKSSGSDHNSMVGQSEALKRNLKNRHIQMM
jgi:amino acid permease